MDSQQPQPEEDENPYQAPQRLPDHGEPGHLMRRLSLFVGFVFLTPLAMLIAFGVTCGATVLGMEIIGNAVGTVLHSPQLASVCGSAGFILGIVLGVLVAGKIARTNRERWRRWGSVAEPEDSKGEQTQGTRNE